MSKPKVIALNPRKVAGRIDNIDLRNPSHPYAVLPDDYKPSARLIYAIKAGTFIDVNKNIIPASNNETVNVQVNLKSEAPSQLEEVIVNEEEAEEVSSEEVEVNEEGQQVQQNRYSYKSKKKYK